MGDTDGIKGDIGVIRETGGDMGTGGTNPGEGAVIPLGPQEDIRGV